MNCPVCGNENLDSHVLCSFCGNSLRGSSGFDQTASAQPVYQQTTPPMYQQPTYQQSYQPPMYQQPFGYDTSNLEEPVTMSEWIASMLICCIPIVGLVMMIVWAFGSDTKKSKANFYKASLLMSAIVFVLYIFLIVFILGTVM